MKSMVNSRLVTGFVLLFRSGLLAALQNQLFETPEILRGDVHRRLDHAPHLTGL